MFGRTNNSTTRTGAGTAAGVDTAPRSSGIHKLFQDILRALQFLSATTSLILFSLRIAKIIRLVHRASRSNGAVEGSCGSVHIGRHGTPMPPTSRRRQLASDSACDLRPPVRWGLHCCCRFDKPETSWLKWTLHQRDQCIQFPQSPYCRGRQLQTSVGNFYSGYF
jgi:hypothetical protein